MYYLFTGRAVRRLLSELLLQQWDAQHLHEFLRHLRRAEQLVHFELFGCFVAVLGAAERVEPERQGMLNELHGALHQQQPAVRDDVSAISAVHIEQLLLAGVPLKSPV